MPGDATDVADLGEAGTSPTAAVAPAVTTLPNILPAADDSDASGSDGSGEAAAMLARRLRQHAVDLSLAEEALLATDGDSRLVRRRRSGRKRPWRRREPRLGRRLLPCCLPRQATLPWPHQCFSRGLTIESFPRGERVKINRGVGRVRRQAQREAVASDEA